MMTRSNASRATKLEGYGGHVQVDHSGSVQCIKNRPADFYLNSSARKLRKWDGVVLQVPELNPVNIRQSGARPQQPSRVAVKLHMIWKLPSMMGRKRRKGGSGPTATANTHLMAPLTSEKLYG